MNSISFDRTQKALYTIAGVGIALLILGILFLLVEIGISIMLVSPVVGVGFFVLIVTAIVAPIAWMYR